MRKFSVKGINTESWNDELVAKAKEESALFIKTCCKVVEGGNPDGCYTSSGEYPLLSFPSARIIYEDNFELRYIVNSKYGLTVICSPVAHENTENEDSYAKELTGMLLDMGNLTSLIPFYETKQHLESELKNLEMIRSFYDPLLEVAQKFDGKVINKKFYDALSEHGIEAHKGDPLALFLIEETALKHNIHDRSFCMISGFEKGNILSKTGRLDFGIFKAKVEKDLEAFDKKINLVKDDIANGFSKVMEFNEKKAEVRKFFYDLSYCFRRRMELDMSHNMWPHDNFGYLRDKFDQRKKSLNEYLQTLKTMRHEYFPILMLIARQYDGKIANKRFFAELEESGLCGKILGRETLCIYTHGDGSVSSLFRFDCNFSEVYLTIIPGFVEGSVLDEAGRLNFERFRSAAEENIRLLDREIIRLEDNIEHGHEKCRLYSQKQTELAKMYFGNMSEPLRHSSLLSLGEF